MKFNSKHILGIILILFSTVANAQFYIGVQAGAGNLESNVDGTIAETKMGGAVKAGYIYSFTKNIGIGSGIEFSQYKQNLSLVSPSSTLTNYEVDASGSAFIYNVTTSNYKEKQTLQAVQIPLFLQLKMNINKGIDFNFRAGVKYFLPVSYKIKATADNVNGTAYYPDFNLTIDDLPEYGIGQESSYAASGEYETKGIFMSSFEFGFTFDIVKKNSLYVAMFLEKGHGTILDQKNNQSYVGFNPTSTNDRKVNGLYSTEQNAKITPAAFGLTLGWNFK
ncbi:hypothetical protein [Flavobacterium quisquiliarum]|uniref:Outer membrane protein beta-barrel domain-containing protein n=1 Tax=Flavobacterium quisquiliarum TaxID=1834436 RepID=A0ABV8W1C6_9FLAO|nr:hypothetical protein [Flavobacterium quisquiliarum]MBW1654572.1 hypothetical protein [Flavobacterium quisquiliarum]